MQICAEEDRINNHDPSHFSYPTLAKATIQRRNNLMNSIDKLKIQLDAAKRALRENSEELEAISRLAEADKIRDQSAIIGRKQRRQVDNLNYAT